MSNTRFAEMSPNVPYNDRQTQAEHPYTDDTHTKLIMRRPASWWGNMWREALPSGNGSIGIAVYGAVQEETILLQHEALWHGGIRDTLPDVSHTLADVRRKIDTGEYHEASWLLADELKKNDYSARRAWPLPLGDIKMKMDSQHGFRHYRRTLNMNNGEVSVRWQDGPTTYERNVFVSRADDMIVGNISASNKGQLDMEFRVCLHETNNAKHSPEDFVHDVQLQTNEDFIYYAAQNDDGTDFGAVVRLIPNSGTITGNGDRVYVQAQGNVRFLVKLFAKGERKKEWQRLHAALLSESRSYDQLLDAHRIIHQPLFQSTRIQLDNQPNETSNEELLLDAYDGELPNELVQKMWAYGRYLFICSTKKDGDPPPLYGLWCGDYKAIWPHHMANENTQMIHWHAPAGGLSKMMLPLFDYYESMMDDFRNNARKLFGCRGIFIPAGTTPGIGVPNQIVPVILNWTGAAGWLAQHYYQYYQYTGDVTFLKERALPFLRETALFYEDFFVKTDGGTYMIYPSVSPENTPSNLMPKDNQHMAHPMPTTINATMDIAIAKEVLRHLTQACQLTGMYEDEAEKWQHMLEHLPDYEINNDGAVSEWAHPDFTDRYDHRHISHVYPVFPGKEITEETDPQLFQAFMKAVEKRLVVGLQAQTGWSLSHLANLHARSGDGEEALNCLGLLARSCLLNNFFTLHNDWRNMGVSLSMQRAPFQIDANMGWVSAVQEMLLFASDKIVKLLPALPDQWKRGRFDRLHFYTGTASCSWDREEGLFEAQITANRHTEVTISLPSWCPPISVHGEEAQVTSSPYGSGYIQLALPAGKQATIVADRIRER